MCLCFAGGAIDLFYRYGFFSLSVRVVPRDDPGSWLVREPTSRVFDDTSIRRTERPGPNSFVVNPIEVRAKKHYLFFSCHCSVFYKKGTFNYYKQSQHQIMLFCDGDYDNVC